MKKKNIFLLLTLALIISFTSCKQKENKNQRLTTSDTQNSIKTIIEQQISKPTTLSFKLLQTGSFYEHAIWENADKEKWQGLFINGSDFYITQAHVSFSRIHDPIVDEDESDKSGWEVRTENSHKSLFLLAGEKPLQNKNVEYIELKSQILPGDTLRFTFLDIQYELIGTGIIQNFREIRQLDYDDIQISDYKLLLKANKNNKCITQVVSRADSFEDAMITIMFAGDIDSDGLLDLLIDNSNSYNISNPTLYLSSPTNSEELLISVANLETVGC